ncbi:MAG: hypothetical protein QOF18_1885 [Frankiaceae bacterium]|nr:hypothetical protein [Frankiaceae bacterium]
MLPVLERRVAGAHAAPRRRRLRFLAAPLLAAAVAVVPAATGQATSPPPGLHLIVGMHHVDVQRYGADQPDLFFPAAVYVASTHGAFEIDPVKQGGHVTLWQVRRTPSGVTRLRRIVPLSPVHMDQGLPGFFRMTLRNSDGKVVTRTTQAFCPTGDFGGSRVDATGPDNPTYPYYCGSSITRATIWGIDQGWAEPIYSDLPVTSTVAPDGNYTLTIRIDPSYVHQLHLGGHASVATLDLTVTTASPEPCPPKIVCGRSALARRVAAGRTEAPAGGRGFAVATAPGGLPDLAALPARDLRVEHNADDGHDYLDFAATIWNRGPGPMDVEGFRRGDTPTMVATQFIYRNGRSVRSAVIGKFEFDTRPGHNHWHLQDFAQYDVLSLNGDRLVRSSKQSFCLAPTDPINLTLPGALWQPDKVGLFSACPSDQSIWLRETLPAGWGDTYVQGVAGQSFDITGLANGKYLIRVTTNPFFRILETTFNNNTSLVKIRLGGDPGARTVQRLGVVAN